MSVNLFPSRSRLNSSLVENFCKRLEPRLQTQKHHEFFLWWDHHLLTGEDADTEITQRLAPEDFRPRSSARAGSPGTASLAISASEVLGPTIASCRIQALTRNTESSPGTTSLASSIGRAKTEGHGTSRPRSSAFLNLRGLHDRTRRR